MKRLLSSWQGFAAGIIATVIYFGLMPLLTRTIAPTAGDIPPGFSPALLHLAAMAAMIYFGSIATVWAAWQIAFRSLDRLYDGEISAIYRATPPWLMALLIQGSFVFMAGWWWACLCFTLELIR